MSRDISLDIAKGIGILLMVIGHSSCPRWLHDSIYSFHMPLFFILSGICLTEKRIMGSIYEYILNKIKRLYLPFVGYGLFFYVVNLFVKTYYYGDAFNFGGLIKDVFLILAMIQTPDLVACYWFLTALFVSSILGFIVLKMLANKTCILVPVLLIIMLVFQKYNIHVSVLLSYKTIYYTTLFVCGYLYKKHICGASFKSRSGLAVLFLFLCTSVTCYYNLQTTTDKPFEILLVFCLSSLGSIGIIWICKDFEKNQITSRVFGYFGEKSMDILTWHLSGLRLMNILLVVFLSLPYDQIMAFPCIQTNPYFWLIYVPFAVLFALSMGKATDAFSMLIHKRHY